MELGIHTDADCYKAYQSAMNKVLEDISDIRRSATNQHTAAGRAFYENKIEKFIESHLNFIEEILLETGPIVSGLIDQEQPMQ